MVSYKIDLWWYPTIKEGVKTKTQLFRGHVLYQEGVVVDYPPAPKDIFQPK